MSLPPPLSSPQCRPVFFDDDASQNQVQNFQSAVVHVFLEVRHFDGAASNDDCKRAVQDMQGTVGTNASPPICVYGPEEAAPEAPPSHRALYAVVERACRVAALAWSPT